MTETLGTNPLISLFQELNRYVQSGEFEKAQKAASKILTHPNGGYKNQKALQCKLVCLIQLSRFQDAYDFVMRNEDNISVDISFERAYCLYRLNRTKEALEALGPPNEDDFRKKELRGQILYRLEHYKEGYDLYRDLVKNSSDDYGLERITNLGACIAALSAEVGKLPKSAPKLPEDTYELLYNKATALAAQGNFGLALDLLKRAEGLCRSTLAEEDATEEEINDEVSVVLTQIGYVNQKMGVPEAASKYYNQALRNKPTDIAVLAIASNNIISLNGDQNIFDSKKKIRACLAEGVDAKLTSRQKRSIALNSVLLHYYGHSSSEVCWRSMRHLESLSSPDDPAVVLLKAALHVVDRQDSKACEVLMQFGASHPVHSLPTYLACAQVYLAAKQIEKALQILESQLPNDACFSAGVLGAMVALCRSLNDDARVAQVFKRAIVFHKKTNPKSELLQTLIRKSAQYFLRLGRNQDAAGLLCEQRALDPQNAKLLAQLVAAYSTFDPDRAREIAKELPSVEDILAQVDVSSLEAANWVLGSRHVKRKQVGSVAGTGNGGSPSPQNSASAANQQSPTVASNIKSAVVGSKAFSARSPLNVSPANTGVINTQTAVLNIVKKKRKKKPRFPKNYDPNVKPDPERWLPRWERSTFKKRGRRAREAAIGKGSQGAVANVADLDASTRPTLVQPALHMPQQPSPGLVGPRSQRPKPQQKKKKKGGKW